MTQARLFRSVRTAHLERAHALSPAPILYVEQRYDFESELAEGLDLVAAPGLKAARWLWRNRPSEVEVNEPLMLESALWTAVSIMALDVRTLMRSRVVTYAIENRDPLNDQRPLRWKSRIKRGLSVLAVRYLARRVDRICYGTQAARDVYREVLRPRADQTLVWALPAAKPDVPLEREPGVVFVSSFAERKGVEVLLKAWPQVRASVPDARLTLIGKGALRSRVEQAAASDPSIDVVIDPPRSDIYARLGAARVVVLPSIATPTWREQVGLPIVEGLSAGCTVVTTRETGLAGWLASHGHVVVPQNDIEALARGLDHALTNPVPVADVLASLPSTDGRLAADRWLFRP